MTEVQPLVAGLPAWSSVGLVLGAVLAVLVAATFAVGTRRFPDPDRRRRPGVVRPAPGGRRGRPRPDTVT